MAALIGDLMLVKNMLPMEIEEKSFQIITQQLGERKLDPKTETIVKRCIHTSADFDYADNLYFTEDVTEIIKKAILNGADIVTDTTMALSGINKKKLADFGGKVHCFIADPLVAKEAIARKTTRSYVAMEQIKKITNPVIVAIGNAPTALIALADLIEKKEINPKAIIAVPVGFVNVIESKEMIINLKWPAIVARGNKGGSNIAAAIINACLYQI